MNSPIRNPQSAIRNPKSVGSSLDEIVSYQF